MLVLGSHVMVLSYLSLSQYMMEFLVLVTHHVLSDSGWFSAACWSHLCGNSSQISSPGKYLKLWMMMEFIFPSRLQSSVSPFFSPWSLLLSNICWLPFFVDLNVPRKLLTVVITQVEVWLSAPIRKESDSNWKFYVFYYIPSFSLSDEATLTWITLSLPLLFFLPILDSRTFCLPVWRLEQYLLCFFCFFIVCTSWRTCQNCVWVLSISRLLFSPSTIVSSPCILFISSLLSFSVWIL